MVAFLKCRTKCLQNVINTLVYFVYLLFVSAVLFVCLVDFSSCVCSVFKCSKCRLGKILTSVEEIWNFNTIKILCVSVHWGKTDKRSMNKFLGGIIWYWKCCLPNLFLFSCLISILYAFSRASQTQRKTKRKTNVIQNQKWFLGFLPNMKVRAMKWKKMYFLEFLV